MDRYAAWAEQLQQSGLMLIGRVISYLPSLLASLALLVVGWLVARLLKALSVRLQAEKGEHCIPAHLFELHSAELLQSGQ